MNETLFEQGLAAWLACPQRDEIAAASYFQQAYEQGDLNAGWMLALCCRDGIGVPQDRRRVYQLAQHLEEQGYAAAGVWLSECYSYGWGVDIDEETAQSYRENCLSHCESASDELDESIRHEALLRLAMRAELRDEERAVILENNVKYSRFPERFGKYAEFLIQQDECHEVDTHKKEVISLLTQGIEAGDESALIQLARLYKDEDHPYCLFDMGEAERLLGMKRYPSLDYADFLRQNGREAELQAELDAYWKSLRYGKSQMRRTDELALELSFIPNDRPVLIRAFDHQVTRSIVASSELANCVIWAAPLFCIDGVLPGAELQVRVRVPEDELDRSFTLYPSSSRVLIDLQRDHGVELSNHWDIEISTAQGATRLHVPYHALILAQNPQLPRCALSWRRKWFQGYSLQVFAYGSHGAKLQIHLVGGASSRMIELGEGDFIELGRRDFDPACALEMGCVFVITSPDCPPCLAVIAPPPRGPQFFDREEAEQLALRLK